MTLNIVSSFNGVSDPDAAAYIEAVEAADGELLEFGVGKAINDFVLGCKADGIWDAIKASCILAGARTLSGALVPLAGAAPTNYNFVSGDYNRETGLVGDASTKYLDSNRASNADPQNSFHMLTYVKVADTSGGFHAFIGQGLNVAGIDASHLAQSVIRNRSATFESIPASSNLGVIATNRSSASEFTYRHGGVVGSAAVNSETPSADSHYVFGRNVGGAIHSPTNARIAFYSIGESLDLAKLDGRVTDLITTFGAAIP